MLHSNPSTSHLPGMFPLLFTTTSSKPTNQATPDPDRVNAKDMTVASVGKLDAKVGNLVNVINSGSNQVVSPTLMETTQKPDVQSDIPIKVFKPCKKKEYKTHMLSLKSIL